MQGGGHTATNLLKCFVLGTLDDDVDNSCESSDEDVSDDDEDGIVESGGMAAKIWAEEDMMETFDDTRTALRYGVALYCASTLDSPPQRRWGSQCRIVAYICDVFNLPQHKRRVVKRFHKDLAWCEKVKPSSTVKIWIITIRVDQL